ncbi:MAG: DUF5674 family protein [Candidatus Saccharimonadales bacterium]
MKQVSTISVTELTEMAKKMYGGLVKGVVDLQKGLLVVDAELHADQEAYLLDKGSAQQDLWGINLYPAKFGQPDFVEFDSMINIRPSQKNMSRSVEDENIRQEIIVLVNNRVTK